MEETNVMKNADFVKNLLIESYFLNGRGLAVWSFRFVKKMSELITSIASGLEFPKYVNRIIYDFEAKKFNKTNRDFEPDGFNLIFPIRNLSCNYSLEFENNCFLLKLNFEIDDEKYPYLRSDFCKNFNFLIMDERFHHQNKTSIVLKSKINAELIERAPIAS